MGVSDAMEALLDKCSSIKNLTVHSVTSKTVGDKIVLEVNCRAKLNAQHSIPKSFGGYDVRYVFSKKG